MEACIVIAKLVGILNGEPTDLYKLECETSNKFVIFKNEELKEVNIQKINKNLSYNIKEI